jgi:mRNA interferase RelE/StbE
VGIKSRYRVQVNPLFYREDLSLLPKELQEDFEDFSKSIFVEDPYDCFGLPHHKLSGKLKDCIALEIEWDGNPNAYRLVYRVLEKPAPRRVEILSFAEHDPAYEKAKERLGRSNTRK